MASRFLYLVRHGEAAEGGGLSDTGEEQARRTGERLKNLPVARIHHSPLPRAAQTARLIAGWLPGVPLAESAVVGDYIPADLDLAGCWRLAAPCPAAGCPWPDARLRASARRTH